MSTIHIHGHILTHDEFPTSSVCLETDTVSSSEAGSCLFPSTAVSQSLETVPAAGGPNVQWVVLACLVLALLVVGLAEY